MEVFFSIPLIFFAVIACVILYSIVSSISEWANNNSQPILTVPARVATKRHSTRVHSQMSDSMPSSSTSTTYYVTFEFETGERAEFRVRGTEFGMLADGDKGSLKYQGTRYLGFERTL